MNDYYYNFQTVIERVPGHIESLCRTLYPEGKKKAGNWCVGDVDGNPGQSFQISLKPNNAGCFIDRSDQTIYGNPISLVALRKNLPYQEAGEWLAKFCGVSPEERVFKRKLRKKPQIDRTSIKSLTKSSIDFAASRGINEETLRQLKVASADRAIVFPHFDHEGEIGLLKYWPTDGSKQIWTNKDPVHSLFGKNLVDPIKTGGVLIITEGQWDAMTWIQLGFPAVSIPSGCENDNWIEEDWVFLNQFTEIYIDFDDDEAGRDAEARVKVRLGYERCKTIRYEFKDANEVVADGHDPQILVDAYYKAKNAPVENIINPADVAHVVQNLLSETRERTGVPFFLPSMRKLEFRPHEATLWFGHTGHGKALTLDTIVPTIQGHKTMEELEVGDYVYGSDGEPTRVKLTSPVFYGHDCYEITFKDGLKIVADADHLWKLDTFQSRMSKRAREKRVRKGTGQGKGQKTNDGIVLTTAELAGKPLKIKVGQSWRNNYSIPVAPAFAGVEADLPIPPYTLGAWLGDGTSASGQITIHDDDAEILDRIESEGFEPLPNKAQYRYGLKGLHKPLREAGLLGRKHIPEIYFNASRGQRMALLMGLMDTDGTISNGRQAELCTVNEDLAHQYQRLANGLGLKASLNCGDATLNGEVVGKKYRVQWTSDIQVFHLSRKAAGVPQSVAPDAKARFIVDVRKVESVPTKCISVEAEDKLFLCTESCLITHNSTAIMNQFAFQAGLGIPGLIASFEDNSPVNYATLLKQFSSDQYIGGNQHFSSFYNQMTDMIRLFDSMRRTNPDQLIATMVLAHKQMGICHFAIDNVMTLDVDRQDNTEQAAVADKFRVFVSRYPVHLHLAAHPRKPAEAQVVRPPQLAEVRGASEWADMSQNAICVYRDVKKAERISEMYDESMDPAEIMRVRLETRDGKFIVRKQRSTGDLPVCGMMFDQRVKRFWKEQEDLLPYWDPSEADYDDLSTP